jgi:hypothetical protein
MIEFDDLTPWSVEESITYYDLGWWLDKYSTPSENHKLGYAINLDTRKVFLDLTCGKILKTDPDNEAYETYQTVTCLLKKKP